MKVVVTGGSGQLGMLVLRRLIDNRAVASVLSIDRVPPLLCSRKLTHLCLDIRDPRLSDHLAGYDALVHLAFIVERYEQRSLMDSVNVEGSRNVFLTARRVGIGRIVHLSSAAVYGILPGQPVPMSEDTACRGQPDFAYVANKQAVETILDTLEAEAPDLAVVRLRPVMLIGRRMTNPMGRLMCRGWLPGWTTAPLPVVWDEDVADAVILALTRPVRGAFNLATDEPLPARALGAAIRGVGVLRLPHLVVLTLARLRVGPSLDPAWITHSDSALIVSSARAHESLGWRPTCTTALDVMRRYFAEAPVRLDRRIMLFTALIDLAGRFSPPSPQLGTTRIAIHLGLTGRHGGDLGIVVDGGRVRVNRVPPRPPDAAVTMQARLLRDMLAGRADWAAAQLTGRVRIEGQAAASLVIAGILAAFRARAAKPDLTARLLRAFGQWVGKGCPE